MEFCSMPLLTEIEAAIHMGMSPMLLTWFTNNAVGAPPGRKLKCIMDGDTRMYDQDDLDDFNKFLHQPWVPKGKTRPALPQGIRREVLEESGFACAFCGHLYDAEAAHIEAWSISRSHHPANLIMACPNHHTSADSGWQVHSMLNAAAVASRKQQLLEDRRRRWRTERVGERAVLAFANECLQLSKILQDARNVAIPGSITALSADLEAALRNALNNLRAASTTTTSPDIDLVVTSVTTAATNPNPETIRAATTAREPVALRLGETCPLCDGSGSWQNQECPACSGEGIVDPEADLEPFQIVECTLCRGTTEHHFFGRCPACSGEGRLTESQFKAIDWDMYEFIECRLCDGKGHTDFYDECPPCNGSGEVPKHADIDYSRWDLVTCELCEGEGHTDSYDECPPCSGSGNVPKHADIDYSRWDLVTCELCEGRGRTESYYKCPPCGGSGEVPKHADIDYSRWDMVTCELCEGRGETDFYDECPPCSGSGEVPKHADIDYSRWDLIQCSSCQGDGCEECHHEGHIPRYVLWG